MRPGRTRGGLDRAGGDPPGLDGSGGVWGGPRPPPSQRLRRVRPAAASIRPKSAAGPLPPEVSAVPRAAAQITPLPEPITLLHTPSSQSLPWHCCARLHAWPTGSWGTQLSPWQNCVEEQSASVVQLPIEPLLLLVDDAALDDELLLDEEAMHVIVVGSQVSSRHWALVEHGPSPLA